MPDKVTILVAKDEGMLRDILRKFFQPQSERYSALWAVDGQHALDLTEKHSGKIDLLLSDVQMPGMTGVDLARKLRESRPDIQVMLMSGYTQGVLLLDHGWTFLQKPFLPSAFLAMIEKTLANSTPNIN